MHLKNRPTYFVKNGIRKPVYYSVDARQLIENGWAVEGSVAEAAPVKIAESPVAIADPKPADIKPEAEPEAEPDLDSMTRAELVQFAEANDVEFKSYASKAEILEACKEYVNG
jgi:hypothetical protein